MDKCAKCGKATAILVAPCPVVAKGVMQERAVVCGPCFKELWAETYSESTGFKSYDEYREANAKRKAEEAARRAAERVEAKAALAEF